jgi:multiple sugar transport system permease protein/raffinose/stachyose/melibiose transport system permease protein
MAIAVEERTAQQARIAKQAARRRASRDWRSDWWKHAILAVFGIFTFYPLFFAVETSLKDVNQFLHSFWWFSWPLHFDNYSEAWGKVDYYMGNSLIVCSASTLGVLGLGSLAGYAFARYRFLGKEFLYYAILVIMMVPTVLTLVPLFLLVKDLRLLNSYWALILPNVAGGQVFAIFLLRSFFSSIPEELFESARLDGAGVFQAYRHVALPLSRPILSVIAITTFLSCWNEFLWPLVTINIDSVKPITTGLLQFSSQFGSQTGILFAAYVLSSVPLVILFIFASSTFVKGITSGALKM